MWVWLTADKQFARSCDDCRAFMYRNGRREPRKPFFPTPCPQCPKLHPDTPRGLQLWDQAADLTPEMAQVWKFYKQCKAVGQFPDDEIVREYAAKIASAEERAAMYWEAVNVKEGMTAVVGDLIQLTRRGRR